MQYTISKKWEIQDQDSISYIQEDNELKANWRNMRKAIKAITSLSLKFLIVNINITCQCQTIQLMMLQMGPNIMESLRKSSNWIWELKNKISWNKKNQEKYCWKEQNYLLFHLSFKGKSHWLHCKIDKMNIKGIMSSNSKQSQKINLIVKKKKCRYEVKSTKK